MARLTKEREVVLWQRLQGFDWVAELKAEIFELRADLAAKDAQLAERDREIAALKAQRIREQQDMSDHSMEAADTWDEQTGGRDLTEILEHEQTLTADLARVEGELRDGHDRIDQCATQDGKGQPLYKRISLVIERLSRRAEESELTVRAIVYEKDELQARASAAECRRQAAERRATRIELDKELQAHVATLTAQVAALREERDALKAENDAAWFDIEHGWSIEPRSYFEGAPNHGFATALGHALHNCWKRTPKVKELEVALAAAEAKWTALRDYVADGSREADRVLAKMAALDTEKA